MSEHMMSVETKVKEMLPVPTALGVPKHLEKAKIKVKLLNW